MGKVDVIDGFLTLDECNALIESAMPRLAKSLVWDVASGSQKEDENYRVSDQMFFGIGETDLVMAIEHKIARWTQTPVENGEGIQVLHYNVGGHYSVHGDYFDEAYEGNKPVLDRGGQRASTFMIYLNEVLEGGGTYFPAIEFRGVPKAGRALYWKNVKEDGSVDPDMMHVAEPVLRGEKWCCTKWIRVRPFI